MVDIRNTYRNWRENVLHYPLGSPKSGWDYYIAMDLRKMDCEEMDGTKNHVKWRAFVLAAMNIWIMLP